MVYLIAYEFQDKRKLPDKDFFDLIESLGQPNYCLENNILLDAAYLSKGIKEEIREYIEQNNGKVIISRVTKDFAAQKLREQTRKFLKNHWDRIPEVEDLGKLP